jgi:hypothetical protein
VKIAVWALLGAAVGAGTVWVGRAQPRLVPVVVSPSAGMTGANAVRRKTEPLKFRRVTARPVRR